MQTAVGVFASRDRAEEAVKNLLEHHIPEHRIIFLTRSESEAKSMGNQLGTRGDGAIDAAAATPEAVGAATIFALPGIGPVFALGAGAAAWMSTVGAGAAPVASVAGNSSSSETSDPRFSQDLDFFRRVLTEGRSVILVRTESSQLAYTACKILDQLGISMNRGAASKSAVTARQLHGAVIADISGKIALAEGTVLLRDTVHTLLDQGHNRILLNLERVDFIDSAGLGELVRTLASVRSHGGQLKLVHPSENVDKLLKITRLNQVFDIEKDEESALRSLRQAAAATSAD